MCKLQDFTELMRYGVNKVCQARGLLQNNASEQNSADFLLPEHPKSSEVIILMKISSTYNMSMLKVPRNRKTPVNCQNGCLSVLTTHA